jgi:hypothetical protein
VATDVSVFGLLSTPLTSPESHGHETGAYTNASGCCQNYRIPCSEAYNCLCETELNLFTRSAPRLKKVINWRGSRILYLNLAVIGKR